MKNKIKVSVLGREIPCDVYEAKTFFQKLAGLMFCGRKRGLLIKNCSSVHTCFMRFDADMICLDGGFKIVKVFYGVKPFGIVMPFKKVKHILEVPSGCCNGFVLEPGTPVDFY